jgi:hypothetical protein
MKLIPHVPVDELPPVDELVKDYWFQSRFRSEVNQSSIAKELVRQGFRLAPLVTQALLSFHRDGREPIEARDLGMEHKKKRLLLDLAAAEVLERSADMEVAKLAAKHRHKMKRQLKNVDGLSYTKHFGVTWQAIWLVILEKQISKRTGWDHGKVMKAVEVLVAIALRSANVQIWFDESRLRELLRSAIAKFENDPGGARLLNRLDAIPLLNYKEEMRRLGLIVLD